MRVKISGNAKIAIIEITVIEELVYLYIYITRTPNQFKA